MTARRCFTHKSLIGVFVASLSGFTTALYTATGQEIAAQGHHIVTVITVAYIAQIPYLTVIMAATDTSYRPPRGRELWMFARTFTAILGNGAQLLAGVFIPLGDVAAFGNMSTGLTMLFGRICIGERCRFFQVIALVLTLVGGILVSQPVAIFNTGALQEESVKNRLVGSAIGFGSAVVYTLSSIVHRHRLQDVNPFIIATYASFTALVVFGTTTLILGYTFAICDSYSRAFVLFNAISLVIAIICYNTALNFLPAGLAQLLLYGSYLVSSFSIQLILGVTPSIWSVAGILCIAIGLIINIIGVIHDSKTQKRTQLASQDLTYNITEGAA